MKHLFLFLTFLLALAKARAIDYYSTSPYATLAGNASPSANWTTNQDGITGLGNVTILSGDNLHVLSGAIVTLSAATTVNDLDMAGGLASKLAMGDVAMSMTINGSLTGSCTRTGKKGYFLMTGTGKVLSYTDLPGSVTLSVGWDGTATGNGGIRITGSITLTGPTTVSTVVELSGSGKLNLNGHILTAGVFNSTSAANYVGSISSAMVVLPAGASNTSNIWMDQGNISGGSNRLQKLEYSSPGSISAFVSIRNTIIVDTLKALKNSSTGCLSMDAVNGTVSIKRAYLFEAAVGAKTAAAGSKLVIDTGAVIVFTNENAKPIQSGSNITINGGILKLNGFNGTPSPGAIYTLMTGGTITGTFAALQLPASYFGTLGYPSNTVTLTVVPPPVYRSDNFDTTVVRSIWSTSTGSSISISTEHSKAGTQSLKWVAATSGKLIASGLNIPKIETDDWSNNATRFYIYNKTAGNDTLIVRFYDNTGVVKRTGRMLLNFSGWRDYFRSHKFDYDNTGKGDYYNYPGFVLNKFELEYKPQLAGTATTIYLDEISFAGVAGRRQVGMQMLADLTSFRNAFNVGTELIDTWMLPSPGTAPAATSQEIADLESIRPKLLENRSFLSIAAAKQFVTNLGISRNADGSINATKGYLLPANVSDNEKQLLDFSIVLSTLAKQCRENAADMDARTKCNDLVEYLLDQGVAEGGHIYLNNSAGDKPRGFYMGFLDVLPYLNAHLKQPMDKMLKWAYQYNRLYEDSINYKPGYDVDFIQNKTPGLFEICFANIDQNESVRDLKLVRNFLERFTVPCPGTRDAFKVDGLAFHHNNVYPGYMYTLNIWIKLVNYLKGTVYKINKPAYDRMSFIIQTLNMPTSPGAVAVYYPNSLSARHPFPIDQSPQNLGLYVKYKDIETLISVGADITGQSTEPELAAVYNYFFPGNAKYPGVVAKDFDYYHQYNYGQLGIARNKKWVAAMKGFTNKFWGTESYVPDNRLGRYQCYGALEFMYGETLKQSGYLYHGEGWDWNVMPGTTSIYLPWDQLKTISAPVDELQKRSFSGALALGKNGIWAMDFEQRPNAGSYLTGDLKFKKSVFTFDSIFVCLGTGITNTTNQSNKTITNLFQNVYTTTGDFPAVFINSSSGQTGVFESDISTTNESAWLVNSAGTGYFIPQGNGNIHLFRGQQRSPKEDGVNLNDQVTANATKAWIDHGFKPTNQRYHFVAVPGVTPGQMQTISGDIAGGAVYRIESQTDSIHAVTYIPQSLTSYAFFSAARNVGIGYVKSISGQALVGVKKEKSGQLSVTINNPDLNTTSEQYDFVTQPHFITLVLKGEWHGANVEGMSIVSSTGDSTILQATVKDGFSRALKLDSAAIVEKAREPKPAHAAFVPYGNVTLSWKGKAPLYNLYFGTDSAHLQPVSSGLTDSSHTLPDITVLNTYYWRVDATDGVKIVEGDRWSFSVVDTVKPLIAAPEPLYTDSDSGQCFKTNVNLVPPVVTDNCGVASLTNDAPASFPVGTTVVNWTATDSSGNVTKAVQTVMVADNERPSLSILPAIRFCYINTARYNIPVAVANDNCGVQQMSYSITGTTTREGEGNDASGTFNSGTSIITWMVSDIHGNKRTAQTWVFVNPELKVTIPAIRALDYPQLAYNTTYVGYQPAMSLSLSGIATGGSGQYSYKWLPTNESTAGIHVSPNAPGTYSYTVQVTDNFHPSVSCVALASVIVQAVEVRCGNGSDKVKVCHITGGSNKNELCIGSSAVAAHLNHGCALGVCGGNSPKPLDDLDLKVFPNPSANYFNVQVQSTANVVIKLTIIDIAGRLMEPMKLIQSGQQLTVGSQYRPGVYLIQITQGVKTMTKMVVKY